MHQVMRPIERVRVLDVPVDVVDMADALAYVEGLIQGPSVGNYVLAVNPEKVYVLKKDAFLKDMFEKAALLLPDGIGVVMAVRLLFGKKIERVPGADLMLNICNMSSAKGYKAFIYGSKEEVNLKAVEKLRKQYPGIQIVGRSSGYVKDEDMEGLLKAINHSGADILFIALGSPKQEKWIQTYLQSLDIKVCQGIGGTLDTITGNVKRAPLFFQKMGLEWFYRLVKEPERLGRQMVLPIFVLQVLKERIGLHR